MEKENIKFKEGHNDIETMLKCGIPKSIWHKKWDEKFNLIQDGNLVGYSNNNGWYFNAESRDEFIQKYSILHNRGIIKPYNNNKLKHITK